MFQSCLDGDAFVGVRACSWMRAYLHMTPSSQKQLSQLGAERSQEGQYLIEARNSKLAHCIQVSVLHFA